MQLRGLTPALAIVPAAGASRRMGKPKLLMPFRSDTIVGCLVSALRAGGVQQVVLVVASADEPLAEWGRSRSMLIARNPFPEHGMLSSVRAGLAMLGGTERLASERRSILVTPADLPALKSETVRQVIDAVLVGAPLAVPVYRGKRGHPLGISPPLLPLIDSIPASQGLRHLLETNLSLVHEISVDDPGAISDIDTAADYASLK